MATKKIAEQTAPMSQDDKLQAVLEQTTLIKEDLAKLSKKVNHFLLWSQIKSIIWLVLFVLSIIATVVYLPPLVQSTMNSYQSILPSLNLK
jgi:hypothetical protein